MEIRIHIPKFTLTVLNQLYELEQKLKTHGDPANFGRNVARMKDAFAEEGFVDGDQRHVRLIYDDPMGQKVKETRTDLEVTISGSDTEDLVVVEVIKPIIRAIVGEGASEFPKIVQRGVVIVESQKEQ